MTFHGLFFRSSQSLFSAIDFVLVQLAIMTIQYEADWDQLEEKHEEPMEFVRFIHVACGQIHNYDSHKWSD